MGTDSYGNKSIFALGNSHIGDYHIRSDKRSGCCNMDKKKGLKGYRVVTDRLAREIWLPRLNVIQSRLSKCSIALPKNLLRYKE